MDVGVHHAHCMDACALACCMCSVLTPIVWLGQEGAYNICADTMAETSGWPCAQDLAADDLLIHASMQVTTCTRGMHTSGVPD